MEEQLSAGLSEVRIAELVKHDDVLGQRQLGNGQLLLDRARLPLGNLSAEQIADDRAVLADYDAIGISLNLYRPTDVFSTELKLARSVRRRSILKRRARTARQQRSGQATRRSIAEWPDPLRTVPYRSRAIARKCRPTGRSGSVARVPVPQRTLRRQKRGTPRSDFDAPIRALAPAREAFQARTRRAIVDATGRLGQRDGEIGQHRRRDQHPISKRHRLSRGNADQSRSSQFIPELMCPVHRHCHLR